MKIKGKVDTLSLPSLDICRGVVAGRGSALLQTGRIRGVAQGTVPGGGVIGLGCIVWASYSLQLL